MSALVINGTTYNGTGGNPYPPSKLEKAVTRIGKTKVMASGLRVFVHNSVFKARWTLSWEKADLVTLTAIAALHQVATTFTFVDQFGTSRTVQCEEDEMTQGTAFTTANNTILYDLQIVLQQGN